MAIPIFSSRNSFAEQYRRLCESRISSASRNGRLSVGAGGVTAQEKREHQYSVSKHPIGLSELIMSVPDTARPRV